MTGPAFTANRVRDDILALQRSTTAKTAPHSRRPMYRSQRLRSSCRFAKTPDDLFAEFSPVDRIDQVAGTAQCSDPRADDHPDEPRREEHRESHCLSPKVFRPPQTNMMTLPQLCWSTNSQPTSSLVQPSEGLLRDTRRAPQDGDGVGPIRYEALDRFVNVGRCAGETEQRFDDRIDPLQRIALSRRR